MTERQELHETPIRPSAPHWRSIFTRTSLAVAALGAACSGHGRDSWVGRHASDEQVTQRSAVVPELHEDVAAEPANVDRADPDPAFDARPWAEGPWLTPTLEAASGDDVLLSRVDALDIASDGRVYVVDGASEGVLVLGADLTYKGSIGRRGDGPGEFKHLTVAQVLPGDSLFVFDADLQRITLFASQADGPEYARPVWGPTRTGSGAYKPAAAAYRHPGNGSLLGVFRLAYMASGSDVGERRYHVLRHLYENHEGQHADSVFAFPSGEALVVRRGWIKGGAVMVTTHPFGRRPYWSLLGHDRLVYVHSHAVSAQVIDWDGRSVSSFSYDLKPIPVTDAEVDAEADEMKAETARLFRDGAPYVWPPVAGLVGDDQERIWLAIRKTDRAVLEWAAFTQDGTHAASVLLPANFRVLAVRDGRLVGVDVDAYDVPTIKSYRTAPPLAS